jgi:hypothetical protein
MSADPTAINIGQLQKTFEEVLRRAIKDSRPRRKLLKLFKTQRKGMTTPPVMNPAHPEWGRFIWTLGSFLCEKGAVRVGLTESFPADEAALAKLFLNILASGCDGDLSLTRTLLSEFNASGKYGCVDIEASHQFFREHGGHCDCEVIRNDLFSSDPQTAAKLEKRFGARSRENNHQYGNNKN